MINFYLNLGAAAFAALAAVFWFVSAAGKTPQAYKSWEKFLDTPEEIIVAIKYSARWNRFAASSAAISALFVAGAALAVARG